MISQSFCAMKFSSFPLYASFFLNAQDFYTHFISQNCLDRYEILCKELVLDDFISQEVLWIEMRSGLRIRKFILSRKVGYLFSCEFFIAWNVI